MAINKKLDNSIKKNKFKLKKILFILKYFFNSKIKINNNF